MMQNACTGRGNYIYRILLLFVFSRTGMFMLTPDRGLPEVARCQKRGHHEHTKHPPVFEVSSSLDAMFRCELTLNKTYKLACALSADQPRHLPNLISAAHMKKAWVLSYPLSAQTRLWSDLVDAQVDLSLCWEHMPFCRFCHKLAEPGSYICLNSGKKRMKKKKNKKKKKQKYWV